ncbi:hypothetical protein HHL23_20140 [Chryseobacterium sp. RP-3-3]|uniref:Uncharacterized protein n=1 Tax=Chryseobacterium antibioticum TaxID=2728847 RepID=A0A7Y0ARC3_9FLAO|nr:hypothetical protein [Chryseobacterium antibioticum]NML72081.1 hypothetical protein [Chryseobacterium antibioticum]
MDYKKSTDIFKLNLINLNIIIKNIYEKDFLIYKEKDGVIKYNKELKNIENLDDIKFIENSSVYDELMIIVSDTKNFQNIDEFIYYSLIKIGYTNKEKLDILVSSYVSLKKEIYEEEFLDLLNWGFLDIFNYEITEKIELNYSKYIESFTFFDNHSKPVFIAILDDSYYFFINNTYT